MKLEPLIQIPSAWTGNAKRFWVHVFEGRVTVDDMNRLEVAGRGWYRKNPGPTVELVIIFPSDARMTSEERTRMAKLIKQWQSVRVASATTILADGMRGAMHRSVLTGLLLLAPPPHPAKVFSRVADAVTWLHPHVRSASDPSLTYAEMQSGVEAFCAEFKARPESAEVLAASGATT